MDKLKEENISDAKMSVFSSDLEDDELFLVEKIVSRRKRNVSDVDIDAFFALVVISDILLSMKFLCYHFCYIAVIKLFLDGHACYIVRKK